MSRLQALYKEPLVHFLLIGALLAHELQPGSLEIRQLTSERYEVIWRAPLYYDKPHPAKLQFWLIQRVSGF